MKVESGVFDALRRNGIEKIAAGPGVYSPGPGNPPCPGIVDVLPGIVDTWMRSMADGYVAFPGVAPSEERGDSSAGATQVAKDGRTWRIGSGREVEWIAGAAGPAITVTAAIPPVFGAYATFYPHEGSDVSAHERAIVGELLAHTPDQPWWLGYLDTGAHDIVFPSAGRVRLYWDWPYVLVEAGPDQALSWRTGHMRSGSGALPDLFFPADRSWLVSALWDDTWTCIGGPVALIEALVRHPLANARRIRPDEDTLPPGLVRE